MHANPASGARSALGTVAAVLDKLGVIGALPSDGFTRLAFSLGLPAGHRRAGELIRELGLEVEIDAAGNLFGRWDAGTGRALLEQGPRLETAACQIAGCDLDRRPARVPGSPAGVGGARRHDPDEAAPRCLRRRRPNRADVTRICPRRWGMRASGEGHGQTRRCQPDPGDGRLHGRPARAHAGRHVPAFSACAGATEPVGGG